LIQLQKIGLSVRLVQVEKVKSSLCSLVYVSKMMSVLRGLPGWLLSARSVLSTEDAHRRLERQDRSCVRWECSQQAWYQTLVEAA